MTVDPAVPTVQPQVGRCRACGQKLIRTSDDCWHPHDVPIACPPEVTIGGVRGVRWGDGFGRPGRDKFVANPLDPMEVAGIPVVTDDEMPEDTFELVDGKGNRYVFEVAEPAPPKRVRLDPAVREPYVRLALDRMQALNPHGRLPTLREYAEAAVAAITDDGREPTPGEDRAYTAGVAWAAGKVNELFAGGPDTVCRTVWREDHGLIGQEPSEIECVEVPMADLRAVLDEIGQQP